MTPLADKQPNQIKRKCPHCEDDINIRNPTGCCDHLYYPECCVICEAMNR